MAGPGVFGAIYPMPESHYPATVIENITAVFGGILRVANFQGHLHYFFGGAAVSRALQDTDTGDDGGVEV